MSSPQPDPLSVIVTAGVRILGFSHHPVEFYADMVRNHYEKTDTIKSQLPATCQVVRAALDRKVKHDSVCHYMELFYKKKHGVLCAEELVSMTRIANMLGPHDQQQLQTFVNVIDPII